MQVFGGRESVRRESAAKANDGGGAPRRRGREPPRLLGSLPPEHEILCRFLAAENLFAVSRQRRRTMGEAPRAAGGASPRGC